MCILPRTHNKANTDTHTVPEPGLLLDPKAGLELELRPEAESGIALRVDLCFSSSPCTETAGPHAGVVQGKDEEAARKPGLGGSSLPLPLPLPPIGAPDADADADRLPAHTHNSGDLEK